MQDDRSTVQRVYEGRPFARAEHDWQPYDEDVESLDGEAPSLDSQMGVYYDVSPRAASASSGALYRMSSMPSSASSRSAQHRDPVNGLASDQMPDVVELERRIAALNQTLDEQGIARVAISR